MWFCSSHNLKSTRNQLLASNSKENAKRKFHDVKDTYFGWAGVINQWNDDLKRMDSSDLRQTYITVDTVYPDKWNKMRATHPNSGFSVRTLNHGMAKYSSILNFGAKVAGIKVDTN